MDVPMDLPKRDFFINRIISGVLLFDYKGLCLELRGPDRVTRYKSSSLYYNYIEECKKENLPKEEDCIEILKSMGLWSEEEETAYSTDLPQNMDKLKIAAYENEARPEVLKLVRDALEVTRKELKRLHQKRAALNNFCYENSATFIKKEFEIRESTYVNGEKYDWSVGDPKDAVIHYYNTYITDRCMRELARTTPWASFLAANKYANDIFGCPAVDMTDEQLMLLAWSNYYESVYSSYERPSLEVINDDDMLDGWRLLEDKKQKQKDSEERGNKLISDKMSEYDEIFIVTRNEQDRKDIDSLNSGVASKIKRDRLNQIKKQGRVKHSELSDVKQELEMQRTNLFRSMQKRK